MPAAKKRRAKRHLKPGERSRAAKRRNLLSLPASRRRNTDDETAAAAALSEKFHGRPARKVRDIQELATERTVLTELGRLTSLTVILPTGRAVELEFKRVTLACSPDGGQLYFVEGDQELPLADLGLDKHLPKDQIEIGEAWKIVYHTSKAFHDFAPADYEHEFGELKGGTLPTLAYDTANNKVYLIGGSYQVRPEGIVN